MAAALPGMTLGANSSEGTVAELPEFLKEPFAAALSQSLLLPAFVALFGVIAALFLRGFGEQEPDEWETFTAAGGMDVGREHFDVDDFPDDDAYVEFTLECDDDPEPASVVDAFPADDSVTEPLYVRVEHPLHAPADAWHSGPVESWHSLLEDEPEPQLNPVAPQPAPAARERDPWYSSLDELLADPPRFPTASPFSEPISLAHNGFHVDADQHFWVPPPASERASGGRHSRDDDAGTYGKHSMRFRD